MEDEIKCLFCLGAVEDDIKVKPFAGKASGEVDCETNLNDFFMEMAGHEACWHSSIIRIVVWIQEGVWETPTTTHP